MADSFAAGRPMSVAGDGTIATALAITEPVPESLARITALVDDIVLVDDDDLRRRWSWWQGRWACSWSPRGRRSCRAGAPRGEDSR